MNTVRIALIGYGNVGRAFARMLERRRDFICETFDVEPVIAAIVTGRHGGVMRPEGIDTEALSDADFDSSINDAVVIESGAYDVMIELTPINIMTGQPVGVVEPTLVDDDIAGLMEGTMSYVTVNTDLTGEMTMIEHAFEPEIDHTAYGVLSDFLRVLTSYMG